jgi:DNA mismatch repair protein MutL
MVVEELLTELKGELLPKEERAKGLARILARKQAIPSGTPLANAMMQQLVDELFACETPYISPSGQLTFVQHSLEDIQTWFSKKHPNQK